MTGAWTISMAGPAPTPARDPGGTAIRSSTATPNHSDSGVGKGETCPGQKPTQEEESAFTARYEFDPGETVQQSVVLIAAVEGARVIDIHRGEDCRCLS